MKTHYLRNSGQNYSVNQKGTFFLSRRYFLFVKFKIYAVASMSPVTKQIFITSNIVFE